MSAGFHHNHMQAGSLQTGAWPSPFGTTQNGDSHSGYGSVVTGTPCVAGIDMFANPPYNSSHAHMPKMDDFAIYSPFPSISGYQSGLGTDTKSMDSVYCMAQSLGLTQNSVQEFISCFGNTLIEKSGARKWARHTLATYTQEDIEKRLDMLLHGYTIKFASEFLHSGASNGSDGKLPAVSKQTYQVLSDATILIRHCRPTSLGTSARTLSQGRITQYLYDSSEKARPTAIALWTIWASHEIQCGRFGTRECRPESQCVTKDCR
jgi:hypothetical protein